MNIKVAVAGFAAGVLTLTACGSSAEGGSGSDGETVSINAFSVMEAANEPVFEDFQATSDGEGAQFQTSYGASGDQSRAVEAGADADVVHYSLETDVTRLVDAGLVAEDWKDNATDGIATSSVVVFVVRKGNPDGIEGWDDLVEPGVDIITPNPGSSGSARWNILAAWAHVSGNGGTEEEARAFVTSLLENTIALPGSGREATTAFTDGSGDVLLSYENEAILAKQSGADIDYVVPEDTLLIQNPAAVTEDASAAAEAFLEFMTSPEAQADYAQSGFRPVVDGVEIGEVDGANDPSDPFPTPAKLFTLDDDFGGWGEAADKFFGDGEDGNPLGIITEIQQSTGKVGEE
ncbi:MULTISPECIES: sulfate ABC transporter substrate-binding protein [unclassified Nocardioides]|uniref:sulfate ABC transporter substrate-binding protein n=1 Tax=unclassified Nocardioides TaxID=2615069 RepID=UPI002666E17D|nr:sulfate ABC transporter substrate-binding protein [Nocardioides sp. Arc9.136]WKN49143.1 sulfate ABC transporter substrate-binding protein [Nocardioides sp. Arc9.136]